MPDVRPAVEALLARYGAAIDAGDLAGVGALFAEGMITDASGAVLATGATEVEALFRATTALHPDGTPCTRHLVTNVVIEPAPAGSPDGARRARSRFVVLQATDGLDLQPIIAGRYDDVVAPGSSPDGTWRFLRRAMAPELLGDLRRHLRFDPALLAPDDHG